jgi:hypothetical protein
MKGVKKMISILVRIISIARMKLLMLPKAKKPDHFACKMGLHTSLKYNIIDNFMKFLAYDLLTCVTT